MTEAKPVQGTTEQAGITPGVVRTPLYGMPCGVCGYPADQLDSGATWSRTWHAGDPIRRIRARYCDVGAPTMGDLFSGALDTHGAVCRHQGRQT